MPDGDTPATRVQMLLYLRRATTGTARGTWVRS